MIVIGDVHGRVDQYLKLLSRHTREPSVQLGDFGIGRSQPDETHKRPAPAQFIFVIGIYRALKIYWNNELADRWVRLANRNKVFGGLSPFEYMVRGGVEAMRSLRNLVDTWTFELPY